MPREARLGQQEIINDGRRILSLTDRQMALARAISYFQQLPGLRAFWPTSQFDDTGDIENLSQQTQQLSLNGNCVFNVDGLAPYVDLPGAAGDHLSKADNVLYDITGTETYVAAAIRGLTFGGWFWLDALQDTRELFGKWDPATNNRSYMLRQLLAANEQLSAHFSDNGTNDFNVASTAGTLSANEWRFVVGRFDPSTEVALFDTGTWYRNVTAIPASVHSGTANIYVGASHGGGNPINGRASMLFICATYLSDDIVRTLFGQTRALFSV